MQNQTIVDYVSLYILDIHRRLLGKYLSKIPSASNRIL